jgi:hypothetical protein
MGGERCVEKRHSGKNRNVDDWLAAAFGISGLTCQPETDSFELSLFEMSVAIFWGN